jgi:TolB-like protein/tetratricopeptide (TPR) repeat protein
LIERPGEIVTRESLRERLWPVGTSVDFDHGLNTAIRKLRHALRDSAENPRFIETLAKHGYRFVAPVTELTDSAAVLATTSADLSRHPAAPTPDARPHRRVIFSHRPIDGLIVGIALVAAAVVTLWLLSRALSSDESAVSSLSADVAVLPLRTLANDEDDRSLGIEIADAVITHLANARSLKLRPTAAILRYRDVSDPVRVARELDVAHILLGTLQKRSEGYRISVQLIRGEDGIAVWGRSYDVAGHERLDVEETIAKHVARALYAGLTPLERERRQLNTPEIQVYELYRQGAALLVNYNEANLRAAIDTFEQALRMEPEYALLRSGLSIALSLFSMRYAPELEASAWGRRASAEAGLAIAQEPDLPEAHLALAYSAGTVYGEFDWRRVLAETDTALSFDSTLALGHAARARAFYHLGLFDLVEAELHALFDLEPRSSVETQRIQLASALFSGRFAHVSDAAERLQSRTDAPAVPMYLGNALFYLGEGARAEHLLASIMRESHPDVRSQAALAGVLAANGKRAEADRITGRTASGPYMDHHVAYSLGAALAQLGQTDRAVAWLRRAANEGFPCYPWFQTDPLLAPIRRDAAFRELLDDLRLRFEEARSRYSS